MTQFLLEMIIFAWDNSIAREFITSIIILFLVASLWFFWRPNWWGGKFATSTQPVIRANGPALLTSLGILGTFVGVFIGLQEFEIQKPDESLNQLLEGLKVAFATSITGLGLGLIFRIITVPFPERDETAKEEINNIAKALKEAVENGMGENIQKLDASIERLIEWQKNYMSQMKTLIQLFEDAKSGIDQTKDAIEKIEKHTGKIPEHLSAIEGIYGTLEQQAKKMEEFLKSLAEVREKAESALPHIEENIKSLTEGMKRSIDENVALLTERQGVHRQHLDDVKKAQEEALESYTGTMRKATQNVETSIEESVENLSTNMKNLIERSREQLAEQQAAQQTHFDNMKKVLEESYSQYKAGLEKMIETIEESMADLPSDLKKICDAQVVAIEKGARDMEVSFKTMVAKLENEIKASTGSIRESIHDTMESMVKRLSGMAIEFSENYEPILAQTRAFVKEFHDQVDSSKNNNIEGMP